MKNQPKLEFSREALSLHGDDQDLKQAGEAIQQLITNEELARATWEEWMRHMPDPKERAHFERIAEEGAAEQGIPVWESRAQLATIVMAHNGSFRKPGVWRDPFLESRPLQPMQMKPKQNKGAKKR